MHGKGRYSDNSASTIASERKYWFQNYKRANICKLTDFFYQEATSAVTTSLTSPQRLLAFPGCILSGGLLEEIVKDIFKHF